MESFYGTELLVGKAVKLHLPEDTVLRLVQVALPVNATPHAFTLVVQYNKKKYIIATLDPRKAVYHVQLDLLFSADQSISLLCEAADKGNFTGVLHVTGYIQPAEGEVYLHNARENKIQLTDLEKRVIKRKIKLKKQ